MRLHGHIFSLQNSAAGPLVVNWKIGESIGKGGEGNVYPVVGHNLVIKILNKCSNHMVCKLMHEIFWNVAMQRQKCAVVPFHYVFVSADTEKERIIGIVMPKFNSSLRSFNQGWIKYQRKYPEISENEYKRKVALAFCEAVKTLHDNNFAHNDIKLGNAVVQWSTLKLKIIDFSLASLAPFRKEKTIGTYAYSYADSNTTVDNERTDCFSVGITLMAFFCPEKYAISIVTSDHAETEKYVKNHLRNFRNDSNVTEDAVGKLFLQTVVGLTKENAEERFNIDDAIQILNRGEIKKRTRQIKHRSVMDETQVHNFLEQLSAKIKIQTTKDSLCARTIANYIFCNAFTKKKILKELEDNDILEFCKTIGFRCWEDEENRGVKRKSK